LQNPKLARHVELTGMREREKRERERRERERERELVLLLLCSNPPRKY
jgi:hypothetical protein